MIAHTNTIFSENMHIFSVKACQSKKITHYFKFALHFTFDCIYLKEYVKNNFLFSIKKITAWNLFWEDYLYNT